jgi:hypothetical protein
VHHASQQTGQIFINLDFSSQLVFIHKPQRQTDTSIWFIGYFSVHQKIKNNQVLCRTVHFEPFRGKKWHYHAKDFRKKKVAKNKCFSMIKLAETKKINS